MNDRSSDASYTVARYLQHRLEEQGVDRVFGVAGNYAAAFLNTIIENPDSRITISGNTDERGSEEYNLALGERRATAVRRYLTDLGVASSRLRTVSFGEAKPAVPGHDESAYRYNRRSEFTN